MPKKIEEIFEGIKKGDLGLDALKDWSDQVFQSVRKEIETRLGRKEEQLGQEYDKALSEIKILKDSYGKLGEDSKREKEQLQRMIEEQQEKLKKIESEKFEEFNKKMRNLEVERDGYKIESESFKKRFTEMSLTSVAQNIASQLNLANPQFAASDLVRDGILQMEEVKDKDGKSLGFKYKLDFEYEDEKTKQKTPSNFEGTDKDFSKLIEGVKTLATNKTSSYARIHSLYPIQESVGIGAGNTSSNSSSKDSGISSEAYYKELFKE